MKKLNKNIQKKKQEKSKDKKHCTVNNSTINVVQYRGVDFNTEHTFYRRCK